MPWERLVTFGPPGFDAYVRLRFLPDPVEPGQQEMSLDADAATEHDLLRTALDMLQHHTETPDDCYFCLWDGWGDLYGGDGLRVADFDKGVTRPGPRAAPAFPVAVLNGPKVALPNRAYFLFHGSLAEFGDWGASAELAPGWPRPAMPDPAFIWPADHAWCVANDVDPHYAGIGADSAAIDDLLAHPSLDVVPADPNAQQPYYR